MSSSVAPRSSLAGGDPRQGSLAKLKEASLTRRRTLPTEHSIPAFRDEITMQTIESSVQHEEVEPSDSDATAAAAANAPRSCQLMPTGVALCVLNLDSTESSESNLFDDTSRLHRLQAVRSLAFKEIGNTPTALDPLRRRLRSTTAQLAFHEANASRQNALTSRKSGENTAPWLPSSTALGSKHKAAQMHAKKKNPVSYQQKENVRPQPRPSPQASALQCTLLSELKNRLQLKGVLLALRQAVQHRHLVESLLERAVAVERQTTLKKVLTCWKEATVPSKEMISAAEFYEYERQVYFAKEALQIWSARSAAQQKTRQAATLGTAKYQHRLLSASLAHWRFATNMKHLSMLRSAVVEGWVDTWGKRKALLAWRRTARRQQLQRNALLTATATRDDAPKNVEVLAKDEDHVVPGGLEAHSSKLLTLAEAAAEQRAVARSQLYGLKLCVAQVAAELESMHPGLRWTEFTEKGSNIAQDISLRPLYDPAAYSSPVKRHRYQDGGSTGENTCPALAAAEEIAADLFNINEELQHVEKECHALRETLTKLEKDDSALVDTEATGYLLAAQQAEQDVEVAMMAFNDAENELREAQVVVEIVNEEIELQKMLLEKCLHEARTSRAAADAAAAALTSARDEFDSSTAAVEAWTKKVTLAAAELARAAPTAKSVAALKLKEARHRLEMEKIAATESQKERPRFLKQSEETAKQAQESEAALISARQSALGAGAADAAASSALNSAQAAFSAAESALHEAQEIESAALSAYNTAIEKAAALREDARQVRLQLFTREREVTLLQARVTELDEKHGHYVALSLEYQQQPEDEVLLLTEPGALVEETSPLCSLSDEDDAPTGAHVNAASQVAVAGFNQDVVEVDGLKHTTWSADTTPCTSPRKDSLSITTACRTFYQSRLLRRAVHALQQEAVQWKELKTAAAYGYCVSILPAAFEAWKEATADAVAIDGANIEIVRVLSSLKAWRSYTAKSQWLRKLEEEYIVMKEREKKATCFAMLRTNVAVQQRHRDALETSVFSRRSSLFNAWRTWAAQQRQLSETLHVALERKRLRCLSSFMIEWRTNSHNDALLRRVFTAALDSWRESLGAAGYEADFSLLQRCFASWNVAAHVQREERRDGVLALAAETTHERTLLTTAFTALKKEVKWANEKESYLPLTHAALLSWREATLTSRSHLRSLAAQHHYENALKQRVFNTWNSHATAIACRVSVFYLKWRVDQRRRSVLAAWRQVLSDRRKWEVRRAGAEALRSKHSSPSGTPQGLPEGVVQVQQHCSQRPPDGAFFWTSSPGGSGGSGSGTTPSTGAHSVTPVLCGSGESWHAKAAEWRQRRALYSGGLVGN